MSSITYQNGSSIASESEPYEELKHSNSKAYCKEKCLKRVLLPVGVCLLLSLLVCSATIGLMCTALVDCQHNTATTHERKPSPVGGSSCVGSGCEQGCRDGTCHCWQGFTLNTDRTTCSPDSIYDCSPMTCEYRCGPGMTSYDPNRCLCPAGYSLSNDNETCEDLDECSLGQHTCDLKTSNCVNTRGSHGCVCKEGHHSSVEGVCRPFIGNNTPCIRLVTGCYILINTSRYNWYQARDLCHSLNSRLAIIESERETQALLEYKTTVLKVPQNMDIWIGLTDIEEEGKFVWYNTGQQVNYTRWHNGYRQYGNSLSRGCVKLRSHLSWEVISCSDHIFVLCERT